MDPNARKPPKPVGRPREVPAPAPPRQLPSGLPFMSCGDCSYLWLPRTPKPVKCPNCQRTGKLELVDPNGLRVISPDPTLDLEAKAS